MSHPPNHHDDRPRTAPAGADAAGNDDPESAARAICLRMLTTEPRTRAQLASALERRGVEDDVAQSVLGQLSEAGLIDDAAFAGAWVDSRHAGQGLGRERLAVELRKRGVDNGIVDEAVGELDPEQEEATARGLVRRKLGSTRGKPADTRARRVMGMLARKGYPAGLAYRLVREELESEGSSVELPDPDLD
ncbi:regulatory protein [Lipingzhangella halophila]|uniref:Regulatory protein RecX n=1 Tax=Lipingzhangella halophila TaxID=1783352 RepID=A0A7W7RDZ9_9ACTN|nr:regulatory protein RecX [Lipingzhangella halophila]MBB4930259.1 regulatory protein [Lipingzhangella halophila]